MKSRTAEPSSTTGPRVHLGPAREDLIDAGALLVLGLIAFFEFRTTFTGWTFLGVATIGMVLGIAITHLAIRLQQPVIVIAAMGVAAFFLLGGAVALRSDPGASVLPSIPTLDRLATGAVKGWRELVTTVPPVDGHGGLLILPYILGLFLGIGGFVLARRTTSAVLPAVVPMATLAAVILLGSASPPDGLVPTAAGYAVVTLLWIVARRNRTAQVVSRGSGTAVRYLTAAALLVASAAGALVVGPSLPGAEAHDRLVVRKKVFPPLDLGAYPSPLAEFRLYAGNQAKDKKVISLRDQKLFTVSGSIPDGSQVRFATLDQYNGHVWAAQSQRFPGAVQPNAFLKVGSTLDNPAPGPTRTMTVRIDRYDDYWMPVSGAVEGLTFTGPNRVQQAKDFRYNLATDTGVAPGKLRSGDSYRLVVAGGAPPRLKASDVLATDASTAEGAFLKPAADALAGPNGTPTERIQRMGTALKRIGRFTHGDPGTGFEYYLPGHSVGRLNSFVKGVIPGVQYVGDDEQFAAAYALMITQLGVPARVVVGVPELKGPVVKGSDVKAWVEVQTSDAARSWRTIPRDAFVSDQAPDKKQLRTRAQTASGSKVTPPAQGRLRSALDDSAQADTSGKSKDKKDSSSWAIPGWVLLVAKAVGYPVLAVGGFLGLMALLKGLRRRRRRTRGAPSRRLANGWLEVTDHARDLGAGIPDRATRREQARALPQTLEVSGLAHAADEAIFGCGELTDEHVERYWSQVAEARRRMAASLGRWGRLRALANPITLLPVPGTPSTRGRRS